MSAAREFTWADARTLGRDLIRYGVALFMLSCIGAVALVIVAVPLVGAGYILSWMSP